MNRSLRSPVLSLLGLATLLAGCGGGGGGGGGSGLAAPTNLVATVNGTDIDLNWNPTTGATAYRVYASLQPNVAAAAQNLLGEAAAPPVSISGLPIGVPLYFRVAAKNAQKTSALSNESQATIPPQQGPDPLLGDQWHLENTGQGGGTPGEDANVVPVWNANITGLGVRIAVVDDGLEIGHEDLLGNVLQGQSHNYTNNSTDPTGGAHGTCCAGVAAAVGNNSVGVSGVAPEASLVGYNLLQNLTLANEADAMTRAAASNWISTNSWGAADNLGIPQPSNATWRTAVTQGVTTGRNGKGLVYLWAAGNGADTQGAVTDNSNLDGQANFWAVMAIGAVGDDGVKAFYSENGANVLVASPSMGRANHGITTVDRTGAAGYNDGAQVGDYIDANYTNTFNGTSSATPLVAGVVALVLEANPNLSWRDVRSILAHSARMNDPLDADWAVNAAGLHINHKYGFGVVDATAAVQLAQTWTNLPAALPVFTSPTITVNVAIPDNDPTGITSSFDVVSTIQHIEFVRVTFNCDNHTYSGDLEVVLTSPLGTQSVLAEPHLQPQGSVAYANFTFGSVRHLEEPAAGQWRLRVRDLGAVDTGTFKSWKLEIRGY